jgi:capsular polysaccharide export protein
MPEAMPRRRAFLFLQGPISPFFSRIAGALAERGHAVHGINLSIGDQLFWRRPERANYRGSLQDWPSFIESFLDREGVTDLILLGEQRDYHKIAIAAARARGIQVVVTDFGYLRPDWITFEREGMSSHSLFPRDPDAILALAEKAPQADLSRHYHDSFRSMATWDMVYHLANYFLFWLYPHYRSHKELNPILVYLGTGLRLLRARFTKTGNARRLTALQAEDAPYFVFPLQMQYDFQIRAYSDFEDLDAAIAAVIGSFARHAPADVRLLVKVHPWDPGLRNWRRLVTRLAAEHGVGGRVFYFDGGDLDAMVRGSRGMVTINSTAGLRALQLGSPVKVLGQAIYDVQGLTFQGELGEFWTRAQPPSVSLLAAYINAMAATIQIRGVFYNQPGLDAAVAAATKRLLTNAVNSILLEPAGRDAGAGPT